MVSHWKRYVSPKIFQKNIDRISKRESPSIVKLILKDVESLKTM